KGVRLFDAVSGSLVGSDDEYGEAAYGVDFDGNGRLATTSLDGQVRLYRVDQHGLHLVAKRKTEGGHHPLGIRFSVDAMKIAVGFEDVGAVEVLSSADL